ncbi:type II toxin-antitoxin system RatA family toxin [Hydrogenovibrio kuenenii]|uniref:type II toxin-antitoxin system RatA family toxin n=1 Tax=Hydrogenovibrio kuenenii TaxID=63658 RepID=UPI00046379EE|nr:type II toxin-antitoxin system RatA family toxin [Hydrogenovibrio kuenenii]
MKKIIRSALLPYSALEVYNIVNDVAAYPEFLPWCGGSEVIESNETMMVASVTIAKAGLKQTFVTQNTLKPGESIKMQLVEGPFSHLAGEWVFKVLDERACKITFELAFEVSHPLLKAALGAVFEQIASTMVQSFCERAKQIYG